MLNFSFSTIFAVAKVTTFGKLQMSALLCQNISSMVFGNAALLYTNLL